MINLTEGAILTMLNPERQQSKDSGFKPVLQVTDIKSVTQTSSDRYLMNLSDGTHMHHGMLATERNELVRSQRLQKGSIVQISLFVSTVIRNHRIIEIIDLEPLLEKCDPIGDPKPLVLNGDASSRVNAKRSNRPNSVVSKEKLAEFAKKEASLQHADKVEKKAKKEACLQHTYKVEKKDREAAQQKLIDEQEANKQLHEELAFIKAHDPASHLASPPTFIKTSPTGVITESENFVESKVLVAEEPEKKKIKIKFIVRSPCYSMEMDQEQQSQAVKKCLHCEITNTPQWRAGPLGPKTLCNACGVRFKAGRLFPEYRPAASPTFVPTVHSNSHRKVLQMRGTVNGKDCVVGTAAKTYVPGQRDSVPVPAPFPAPFPVPVPAPVPAPFPVPDM